MAKSRGEPNGDPFFLCMWYFDSKRGSLFLIAQPPKFSLSLAYQKRTLSTSPDTFGPLIHENRTNIWSDLIINNLYWRNTRESVTTEFSVPTFSEEVVVLDFHPVEAALYNDAKIRGDEGRCRQLANSPHLSAKERKRYVPLFVQPNLFPPIFLSLKKKQTLWRGYHEGFVNGATSQQELLDFFSDEK